MPSDSAQVLLTGTSSLTGAAFASALHTSGFDVIAATTRPIEQYSGLQEARVRNLPPDLEPVPLGPFGSPTFLRGLESLGRVDVVLFHHAHIGDHRSTNFDIDGAVESSTRALREVLEISASKGAQRVVITRSVFEAGEGGDEAAPPYSGYGVAKTRISRRVRYEASRLGLATKDFVIANPVGPLEKPGISSYLAGTWLSGEAPTLASPAAMRDFVPIDLLAREFVQAVSEILVGQTSPTSPSMWPMRVADWADLLSREFGRHIGLNLDVPTSFSPGHVSASDRRIGRDPVVIPQGWSEQRFWDEYLRYLTRGR